MQSSVLSSSRKGEPLLGKDTAIMHGVPKIGIGMVLVKLGLQNSDEVLRSKYPKVFGGVGIPRLKHRTVQLHINPDVKPIAQPARRVPFSLRGKVEEKINELVSLDIIEPVEGPTSWVNPVVIVPKSKGGITLCIDMRRANEAILHEKHPIPTIDEITQGMSGSCVFSKHDLKWGYHQLELTPRVGHYGLQYIDTRHYYLELIRHPNSTSMKSRGHLQDWKDK